MRTSRLEAFSDGVLAIIITIMVLELRPPDGDDLAALVRGSGAGLLTYLLSFLYVGIYWNNHHHMFHLVHRIGGGVLWANLGLLFCLSLFPFTTSWVEQTRFAQTPVLVYGVNLLAAGLAYVVLQTVIIRQQGADSPLREAVGSDVKGKVSAAVNLAGVLAALLIDRGGHLGAIIAMVCYGAVVVLWVVPDRRIDRVVRVLEARENAAAG
ncbi:TMEM175 family protein [Actinoplanes subtropicus]|uniref:TMEM175 family protein n=1 Tax=Actinoplanes subtropicus TaxID=543632 RepID=UPI0004C3D75D|nr:TMEM175 family protein [Actinoplanes subtropicus]